MSWWKKTLFIVWGIGIWQVGVWAFASPPPAPQARTVHPDNVGKAYDDNEKYTVESRVSQRRGALEALGMPRGEICSEAGAKRFRSALREYLFHRQNQSERYPEIYGQLGANYIAKQWASADDSRIERKVQDSFRQGLIKPDDFEGTARKLLTDIVKRDRIEGRGCAA